MAAGSPQAQIGVPLAHSGRQRKMGRAMGYVVPLVVGVVSVPVMIWLAVLL